MEFKRTIARLFVPRISSHVFEEDPKEGKASVNKKKSRLASPGGGNKRTGKTT